MTQIIEGRMARRFFAKSDGRVKAIWAAGLIAILAGWYGSYAHATESFRQTVDGIEVFYAIVPAELVRGHPREHVESRMHGEWTPGESHLIVALFDIESGKRISDATITAEVQGAERVVHKRLEPMLVGGGRNYGHYFRLPGLGPYEVRLSIEIPERDDVLNVGFQWGPA